MKVAIVGYGVVGTGVDLLLKKSSIEVSRIFVRTSRLHEDERMCDDFDKIINDPSIDVIVEALGGIEPAHTFILQAMEHGKSVVSANKAVIAQYFEEFHKTAQKNNISFLYEASVGGTIPILKTIYDTIKTDSITSVGGILNGTSNYILTKMEKESLSFEEALKQAQEAGYAESNPYDDIEGIDIRNKIMIASSLAFQTITPLQRIPVMGISKLEPSDFDRFSKLNLCCKLYALAKRNANSYSITVEPTLFSCFSIQGSVMNNYNMAFIETQSSGQISIIGQGAGQMPTAHSVVADLHYIENQLPQREFTMNQSVIYCDNSIDNMYYIKTNLDKNEFPANLQKKIIWEDNNTYFMDHLSSKELMELEALDNSLFFARCDEEVKEMIKKEVIA